MAEGRADRTLGVSSWSPDIADEDLLARLLELNLARAGSDDGLLADTVDDADSDVDDQ